MKRPSIPGFLCDLDREPGAVRTLGIASLSLFAAGLNPRVFSPGLSSVQAAIRENSQAEALLLLATVVGGGLFLIGGVLGDADGRRRLLMGALATMLVTAVIGLFVTDGPAFVISRMIGLAAASVTLPIALAGVAETYGGMTRATAIGIAYAAYGAATAAGPILLTLFGPNGPIWPAFIAAGFASVIALVAARSGWHDLPVPARGDRRAIWATATWACGIVLLGSGIIGFRTRDDPLRPMLIVGRMSVFRRPPRLRLLWQGREQIPPPAEAIDDPVEVALALPVPFVVGQAGVATVLVADSGQPIETDRAARRDVLAFVAEDEAPPDVEVPIEAEPLVERSPFDGVCATERSQVALDGVDIPRRCVLELAQV